MWFMRKQPQKKPHREELVDRCLKAFIEAGTLDVSLDQLASRVRISKRMLIHYFGGRENLELSAIARLEDSLRGQFAPEAFSPGVTAVEVVTSLWERTTAEASRGVLLLVMDISRRAWNGSARARAFYAEQQRLWVRLLLRFIPDRVTVEAVLQVFQGAILAYLITGDREPGERALVRALSAQRKSRQRMSGRRRA
jgi:AcrR family transcriptional regulator